MNGINIIAEIEAFDNDWFVVLVSNVASSFWILTRDCFSSNIYPSSQSRIQFSSTLVSITNNSLLIISNISVVIF